MTLGQPAHFVCKQH